MTDKVQKILQKMKHWKRFANPGRRDRILNEFNRDQMDDVGPLGGQERGMKVLSEMNSLTDEHDQFVKSLASRVDIL